MQSPCCCYMLLLVVLVLPVKLATSALTPAIRMEVFHVSQVPAKSTASVRHFAEPVRELGAEEFFVLGFKAGENSQVLASWSGFP